MTASEFRAAFGAEVFAGFVMPAGRIMGDSMAAVVDAIEAAERTFLDLRALHCPLPDELDVRLATCFGSVQAT